MVVATSWTRAIGWLGGTNRVRTAAAAAAAAAADGRGGRGRDDTKQRKGSLNKNEWKEKKLEKKMQWDTKQKFNCPLLAHTHTHTHREKEQLRRPVSVRKDNRKILYLNRPGVPCFMPSYPFLFFFKRLVVFFSSQINLKRYQKKWTVENHHRDTRKILVKHSLKILGWHWNCVWRNIIQKILKRCSEVNELILERYRKDTWSH